MAWIPDCERWHSLRYGTKESNVALLSQAGQRAKGYRTVAMRPRDVLVMARALLTPRWGRFGWQEASCRAWSKMIRTSRRGPPLQEEQCGEMRSSKGRGQTKALCAWGFWAQPGTGRGLWRRGRRGSQAVDADMVSVQLFDFFDFHWVNRFHFMVLRGLCLVKVDQALSTFAPVGWVLSLLQAKSRLSILSGAWRAVYRWGPTKSTLVHFGCPLHLKSKLLPLGQLQFSNLCLCWGKTRRTPQTPEIYSISFLSNLAIDWKWLAENM